MVQIDRQSQVEGDPLAHRTLSSVHAGNPLELLDELLTLIDCDELELLEELDEDAELADTLEADCEDGDIDWLLELAEIELADDPLLDEALDTLELVEIEDELELLTLKDEAELLLDRSSIDSTRRRSPLDGPGNNRAPVWKLSTSNRLDSPVVL